MSIGGNNIIFNDRFFSLFKEFLMTKFTKISLAALFSIFLSACDKPATDTATKTEAAQSSVAKTADTPADAQGVADFEKLLAWKSAQETALNQAQNDLQQGIKSQDQSKIDEGFKAFQAQVADVLKSLDELNVTNPDVVAFKAKTKESLVLSNELISTWVNAAAQPSPEVQKLVQEKAQKLIELGAELQQTQLELQKKFVK